MNNIPVKEGRAPNFQIRLSNSLVSRLEEYRTYVKNRTNFYPTFNEAVRSILDTGLNHLGIPQEKEDENP